MAYVRFYRRIPIIPGLLYLNIAKRSISISIGKQGWRVTAGKDGIRFTLGLPGSGLSVTEYLKYRDILNFKRVKEVLNRVLSSK